MIKKTFTKMKHKNTKEVFSNPLRLSVVNFVGFHICHICESKAKSSRLFENIRGKKSDFMEKAI